MIRHQRPAQKAVTFSGRKTVKDKKQPVSKFYILFRYISFCNLSIFRGNKEDPSKRVEEPQKL